MGLSAITMAEEGDKSPIKGGVLHSLSGTMAFSETTLKDTVLMLTEKQNDAGGVLGRPLEAVVVDPASNWPLFAEKARELVASDAPPPGIHRQCLDADLSVAMQAGPAAPGCAPAVCSPGRCCPDDSAAARRGCCDSRY